VPLNSPDSPVHRAPVLNCRYDSWVIEAARGARRQIGVSFKMSMGPWQIVIIAVVILVLFGANRIGDIGKGLGEGIKNFKKGIADDGTSDAEKKSKDDSSKA
jgi:sec-independent protein translocase protein TatA